MCQIRGLIACCNFTGHLSERRGTAFNCLLFPHASFVSAFLIGSCSEQCQRIQRHTLFLLALQAYLRVFSSSF